MRPAMLPYPSTRTQAVVDVLHGEPVSDPYRWLEDGTAVETREWTAQQNAFTEAYLGAVPGRDRIRKRLEQLLSIGVPGTPPPSGCAVRPPSPRAATSTCAAMAPRTSRSSIGGPGAREKTE